MNELQVFNNPGFGEIRTIEEDGKVLFCGSDVARALGFKKPNDAIAQHCRYTVKRGIPHPQSPNKNIQINFIPEGDLYRLIANSKLPTAQKFESWVFDDVLPTIRKTGTYNLKQEQAHIKELNAKTRQASLLTKIADKYPGTTYQQVLHSHATALIAGQPLLPLPELPERTYTAAEIGERLGISANMVGKLTNRHHLKTDQYGKWFHNKARGIDREVQSFQYYESVIPELQKLM